MFKITKLTQKIWLINNVLHDHDRKSIPKILIEMIIIGFRDRCFPNHYLSRFLYKKDQKNYLNYLPNKFIYNIKSNFNDRAVADVMENKLFFNYFYSQFNICMPKTIMFNHSKMFCYRDKHQEINNVADFKSLLINVIQCNTSDNTLFIKKTYGSYGGEKIFKITLEQIEQQPLTIDNLFQEVIQSGFIYQENVIQHPDINMLNPSCLNTIRLDTFIDNSGHIDVISGFMRMSIENSHVDNVGAGGCFVGLNLKTGLLKKFGYMPFKQHGGNFLTEHPVTKTIFEHFKIPYVEEAKNLVIRTASLMPGLRLVGWDVGITPQGPILIEGNSDYNLTGGDLTDGGYMANNIFRKALKEINYIN